MRLRLRVYYERGVFTKTHAGLQDNLTYQLKIDVIRATQYLWEPNDRRAT